MITLKAKIVVTLERVGTVCDRDERGDFEPAAVVRQKGVKWN